MKRKLAFMLINGAMTEPKRTVLDMGAAEIITVAVGSYDMACEEAKRLVEEGIILIELCGGFGTIGHARVVEAIDRKIQVGIVRFDNHPGYNGESGDDKWL